MADVTGTPGNDFLFFNGTIGQFTATITNPYSGLSLYVDEEQNINSSSYEGLSGFDTLIMSSTGDVIFADSSVDPTSTDTVSMQILSGVDRILAGEGGDVIVLASNNYVLDDMIIEGAGDDDIIWANAGDDTIYGRQGDDLLDGGPGDDNMYGNEDNDILYGGDGNDIIVGGPDASQAGVMDTVTFSHVFSSDVIFPDLQERVDLYNLDPPRGDSLGLAPGDLSVDYETTATITFQSTGAGYNNSLGFYNIAADGTIQGVDLAFTNVKNYSAGDTATLDLPGQPDTDFGFFVIANGARKNKDFDRYDLENGEFKFVYDYGKGGERLANINDAENDVKMVYYGPNGEEKVIVGSNNHIYHTTERGGATNLNSDGEVHTVSGLIDGNVTSTLRIGFEDLPNLGDADYNDVVFDLIVNSQTETTLLVNDQDVLYGGAGDDILDGGVDNDVLIGGLGADTLTGGDGDDMFVFDVMDGASDFIDGFELGADNLNITDILDGFDPLSDAIADFVQLTQTGSGTKLNVNADGDAGGAFDTVAVISTGLENTDLADLINQGGLTTDQSFFV